MVASQPKADRAANGLQDLLAGSARRSCRYDRQVFLGLVARHKSRRPALPRNAHLATELRVQRAWIYFQFHNLYARAKAPRAIGNAASRAGEPPKPASPEIFPFHLRAEHHVYI
jgi:hypothetical protein